MDKACGIYPNKVSREERISFGVSVDPFYSKNNIRYLEGIKKDIDEGQAHLSEHELIEVDD